MRAWAWRRSALKSDLVKRAGPGACSTRHVRAPHKRVSRRRRLPLRIGAEVRSFCVAGREPVDLSTRGALQRILRALVAQRKRDPHATLSPDDLLQAGWPDDKVDPTAGAQRVYVAISTLRKMGLKGLLLRRDDGYMLDPAQEIALS